MNTLWKVASLSALATVAACGSTMHTREVIREQPVVQQQPVVERERVVVMTPPAAPAKKTATLEEIQSLLKHAGPAVPIKAMCVTGYKG